MIALIEIENEDGCEHKTDVIDVSVIKRCSGGECYTQNKCVLYKPRTSFVVQCVDVLLLCACASVGYGCRRDPRSSWGKFKLPQ